MPTANVTREMRLFSRLTQKAGEGALPVFIARRRQPGASWESWDEIIYQLRRITGEIVTNATMRKWARTYGIPEYTEGETPASRNRFSGRALTAEEYAAALDAAGIKI